MYSRIQPVNDTALLAPLYQTFLTQLSQAGFSGEIQHDYASRTVFSTDNSIYQRLPQAIVFPKHIEDVTRVATLLALPQFQSIVLTARGGGTGTNGQSLTDGIVMDLSRHLNQILEINVEQRWARVQAGVVKDQLNEALKTQGLFFAPELSTSNRATIGGMINTDASGQGSCVYGKTRDHVIELDTILIGGERLHSQRVAQNALPTYLAQSSPREKTIYQTLDQLYQTHAELIETTFPKLNRCLTGYDLAHLKEAEDFHLNSVLCGSEGTLGLIVEAKINLLPIPRYRLLINLCYASFIDALRDAKALMQHQPLSIETVDSMVLELAQQDAIWHSVGQFFPDNSAIKGINLIEFSGDDQATVENQVNAFLAYLDNDDSTLRLGHTLARGEAEITRVYAMRKRAVGLLGNRQGEARPQPFIEDIAIPPEKLADFIVELRALLDRYQLQYGMFGHVDAGVLHVRPALDMKDPQQAALIRPITDQAVKLIEQYGGLLWGEHGKGLRSEYVPQFFGALYPAVQQVKQLFDPHNQLNPGKIATPQPQISLSVVDAVPFRGESDRQIACATWQSYGASMHCNGNGACYNYDVNDAMCPSWKATRERIHSPKGRASVMKEWLRLQQLSGVETDTLANDGYQQNKQRFSKLNWPQLKKRAATEDSFNHEVYQAMAGCLACKSCVGQCPVKVNVPEIRSRFLFLYHQRYVRPLRDYLVASLEFFMPKLSRFHRLYNSVMRQKFVQQLVDKGIGMVDSPLFDDAHATFKQTLKQWQVKPATEKALSALTAAQKQRAVILVQDTFTRYFDTSVMVALIELISRMGYSVWLAQHHANGKPLHVQGFRKAFMKTALRNNRALEKIANMGIPLVGLDPAMTLIYRQEYAGLPDMASMPTVLLPQEWLSQTLPLITKPTDTKDYQLFLHCTEKTNAINSNTLWQQVFSQAGLNLTIGQTGCCGMSGTYGHESRNLSTSKTIFQQSWAPQLAKINTNEEVLVTGYSCRSQVKRLQQKQLRHPIQVLLNAVIQSQSDYKMVGLGTSP